MYIDIVNGRIGGYLPYTSVQPSEEQRQDYMNDRRLNHLCPQTYNRGFMYFSCIIINYKSINIYTPYNYLAETLFCQSPTNSFSIQSPRCNCI